MTYANFWRRFGAFWVDFIVLIPMMVIAYYGSRHSRLFHLYWLIPSTLIGIWFHVHLVTRYGGTPGKLALRTKIVMIDGSPITRSAAFLRFSVLLVLTFAGSIALCMASLNITDEQYLSLTFTQQSHALISMAPSWYTPVSIALQIWIWSEFITILFNKKRRAIHDFIAKTVVIRTS